MSHRRRCCCERCCEPCCCCNRGSGLEGLFGGCGGSSIIWIILILFFCNGNFLNRGREDCC
ncbi:MAG: hypothetical protein FWC47_15045 [Oscillospiraceae bacterium]|nr:hypothetical protein [Oscillospiraceae bacterium]